MNHNSKVLSRRKFISDRFDKASQNQHNPGRKRNKLRVNKEADPLCLHHEQKPE